MKGTDTKGNPLYEMDKSVNFTGKKAARIVYFLRLTDSQNGVRRIFVSMKSFTGDVREAGIPRMPPKKHFKLKLLISTSNPTFPVLKTASSEKETLNFRQPTICRTTNRRFQAQVARPSISGTGWLLTAITAPCKSTTPQKNRPLWRSTTGNPNKTPISESATIPGNPDWTFTHNAKKYQAATLLILDK